MTEKKLDQLKWAIIMTFVGLMLSITSSGKLIEAISDATSWYVYHVVWDDDTRTRWDSAMSEINSASEEMFKESIIIAIEALRSEETQKEIKELEASGKDWFFTDLKSLEPFMDKLNGFDIQTESILNKHGFYRSHSSGIKDNLISYGGYIAK